jgi:hypothetical protein
VDNAALVCEGDNFGRRQRNLFADEPQHRAFWQARFYDFNVWTTKKRAEKLRYIHRNPVKRGPVELPEQWRWSSYRFYLLGEIGIVRVKRVGAGFRFRIRRIKPLPPWYPPFAQIAKDGAPNLLQRARSLGR